MSTFVLVDTDLTTELTSLDIGDVTPGRELYKKIGIKNDSSNDYNDVTLTFFPGLKNNEILNTSGTPIVSADIIKMTVDEVMQVVDVDKEDDDALMTLRDDYRGRCYEYDADTATWTDYTSGDVTFLSTANKITYIGTDYLVYNLYINPDTQAGDYTGLTIEYWNGTAWTALPGDAVDNTFGLSVAGNIYLGSIDSVWRKSRISGAPSGYNHSMYWLRITASDVTTEAISTNVFWNYLYYLDKYFAYGNTRTFYEITDDITPVWNEVTPDYSYANAGIYSFKTCPLTDEANHELRGAYSYKTPQPATYNLTFPTTSTCSVNGAEAVSITADGVTQNTNIIPGMAIVLSATLADTNTATIVVDDMLSWLFFALDTGTGPDTWQNEDLNLGTILAGDTESFYIGFFPESWKATSDNYPYAKPYAIGSGA